MNNSSELDIGPLTWVKGEIDLALERSASALSNYAAACAETCAAASADPGQLKSAQAHLHQAHGALSIVGLAGITQFSDTLEQTLAALAAGTLPFSPALGAACQRALSAIPQYLDDLLNGQPDQPLRLYPLYRELMTLRGVADAPPADLFFPDLSQRPPRREREPAALTEDTLTARRKAARLGFQRGLLKWLKGDAKGLTEMRNSVAVIEFTQQQPAARAFWWISLGFLDALIHDGLPVDAGVKRLCARIDAQIGKLLEGSDNITDRLYRDALYYVAASSAGTDHIECVRAAYRLGELLPQPQAEVIDIAPHMPHLRAMRETLEAAKEDWSRYAASAGDAHLLQVFIDHTTQLIADGQALGQMDIARLVVAIHAVAGMLRNAPAQPYDAGVALEIATALLLVEIALDEFGRLGVDFAHQVDVMTSRLNTLLRGEPLSALQILEQPHLVEVSQRAQKRMLVHQVAREMLNNLVGIEQTLDGFFRAPTRRQELTALHEPLKQVEGALDLLGELRARAVLLECEAQIAGFTAADSQAGESEFGELAHKLSALSFFVEQLQHGPADIDAILKPGQPGAKSEETTAPAVAETAVEDMAEIAVPPASAEAERVAAEAEQVTAQLAASETAPASDTRVTPPLQGPSPEATRLLDASSATIDAELLAIFLEEAHEVLDTIAEYLPRSLRNPHDREPLNTIRRAFHTLKGSGRMVNLAQLGEVAWTIEQTMNHWLPLEQDATPLLHAMLEKALGLFNDWVDQLALGGAPSPAPEWRPRIAELEADCERLQHGDAAGEPAPGVTPVEATTEATIGAIEPPPQPADEQIVVGDVRLSASLYNVYLTEARSHLEHLHQEQPRLGLQPPSHEMLRAAHTLGGISGTLGVTAVKTLARALERALERFTALQALPDTPQQALFAQAIDQLDAMLAAFAARQPASADAGLLAALEAVMPAAPTSAAPMPVATATTAATEVAAAEKRHVLRLQDDLDPQLLPLFLEEGHDLLREIAGELHAWHDTPQAAETPHQLQRLLHTLKGGARMAGAMRMGELVHGMETRIVEHLHSRQAVSPALLDEIDTAFDRAQSLLDELEQAASGVAPTAATSAPTTPAAEAAATTGLEAILAAGEAAGARGMLRVRAEVVDELVNEAGEMAIARTRIEGEMRGLKASLLELTENVIRLRQQLREIEIQAESQMQSQMAQIQETRAEFDPLEMDRFSRFQELTRMMAESVNDVTTVQHNLLRNLDHADAALSAQARLNRELSQSLMNVRMVPFDSISDRLYRVIRKTAKELGKRANLTLHGAQLELDRSVLEKITGPLEHLLRNAVAHGIEMPAVRQAAGKPAVGEIALTLRQEGNEVIIDLGDDGAGLDFAGIRAKAIELGLASADQELDERRLTQFIFLPGFSTAAQLNEVAGRGVGMDVVKTETALLGGRIDVHAQPGQGTRFRIYLPLTLAVAQVLLVQAGNRGYALPSTMIEQVQELKPAAIEKIRQDGHIDWLGVNYPWHYLPRLLGDATSQPQPARRHWLLFLKGGDQHLALEVDSLMGNQEIVLKKIGPQLARVPGIAGATVLGNGDIALVLNPVALVNREHQLAQASGQAQVVETVTAPSLNNSIMVVDDSLTVRKITSRLLTREGFQVVTAKDGVDALEQLLDFVPAVMLVDIEMPRMDGFDLTRNVRLDPRLKDVPIIMITSRIADKHRNYAREIGVNEYLGKPYDEEALLHLIRSYLPDTKPASP